MSNSKKIAYSIIKFLKEELKVLSPEACESIEVAIQCLENAYEIHSDDASLETGTTLAKLFESQVAGSPPVERRPPTAAEKEQAENLKTEGNNLMKAENFVEALTCYTKAIELDPYNPVYYCNRAAAHTHLNNHQATIEDCKAALKIEPTYSKAYGRLGLAYSNLGNYKEAKINYEKALELEPGNQTYINNIELNEEILKKSGNKNKLPDLQGLNMSALASNPSVIQSLLSQFLSHPNVGLMASGSNNENFNRAVEDFLTTGQNILQQMQTTHPEMVQELDQICRLIDNSSGVKKDQPPKKE